MLSDISNQYKASLASPTAPSKRILSDQTTTKTHSSQKQLYTHQARFHAASSSSPSRAGASSPFFSNTRLDAFHASSSPAPSGKLLSSPTKRSNILNSLPPSSPSFELSSSTALELASKPSPDEIPAESEPLLLHLERGTVLYFGRKAKKAIPRTQSPGFNPVERTLPILLPKSAKNASRIHCSARIVKDKKAQAVGKVTMEVRVTGQNGMRIDGKLWKAGSLARLTVDAGRELELAFWGWDAKVVVAETEKGKRRKEETTSSRPRVASPASSSLNSMNDDESEAERPKPSKRQRQASPTLSTNSLSSPESDSSSSSLSIVAQRARSLASDASLDLPGLLASTIVFHPRSTVGVDELVRALLKESGQGMWQVLSDDREEVERLKETTRGEEDAVEAWIPVCQEVLRKERMFGMIDNTGLKDAAGRPLPPYFFYKPDLDSSPSRVEALEPFVKRVRGARTSKPVRYFWAKPSLKKNKVCK
ncbi:hypothetical protein JCM5353_008770 [Sporobolomyces roseus]